MSTASSTYDSESDSDSAAVEALAGLYHSWITGLVLTILNRRDGVLAEEFVFQLFRRQHLERFLPGLEKLGLADEDSLLAAGKEFQGVLLFWHATGQWLRCAAVALCVGPCGCGAHQ
jgi:hypothetical protein